MTSNSPLARGLAGATAYGLVAVSGVIALPGTTERPATATAAEYAVAGSRIVGIELPDLVEPEEVEVLVVDGSGGARAAAFSRVGARPAENGIPAAALAAYQRAAQVIGGADAACNLQWQLLAAIGRVESDHGRYGGNVLSAEGVSSPGIYGIPLDGTNGTQKITDTDAGQYDQDNIFDRAVGPMQFIPSTWSVVGVDGDGDGKRNPQDIDDAALASAVYLCSGNEDIATDKGASAALYRYNHSQAYVDLVLSIADAYASGDYTAVPTSSYAPTYFGPSYDDSIFDFGTVGRHSYGNGNKPNKGNGPAKPAPTGTPAPTTTPQQPSAGGNDNDGKGAKNPAEALNEVITKVPEAVNNTVTELQKATEFCAANLTQAQLNLLGGLQACAEAYLDSGLNAINALLDSLGLDDLIGGLLPPAP